MNKKDNTSDKLEAINERIQKVRLKDIESSKVNENHKKANLAWRMVIELVVGMVIGFFIGYSIDTFFNTEPVFIIIMSLLGFAAGIRTMMRTSRELNDNK
jgi:ATP synthase protein I